MATALEQALGPQILLDKRVAGWVNVPADCVRSTDVITLHAGRAAGMNEPVEAGVAGVGQMLAACRRKVRHAVSCADGGTLQNAAQT
jgi:hydroxypyruvate reductase